MDTKRLLLSLSVTLLLAACGGGGGSSNTDTTQADTAVPADTGAPEDTATGDTATGCGIAKPTGALCNPYPGCDTGCDTGQVCTNIEAGAVENLVCHASDGVPIGGVCNNVDGPFCADGACIRNECRQFCDKKEDCDNATDCRSYQSGDLRVNVCGATAGIICDPFQPNVECGAGTSCYRDVVTAKSTCLPSGDGAFGEACACTACCAPGLTCTRNDSSATGVCGENCVAGGPGERGCAERCLGLIPWRPLHDANTVAFCVPFESYPIASLNVGGGSVNGELTEVGEYDILRFAGQKGQVLRVSLTTPAAAFDTNSIDAILSVHRASDGIVVAIADDAIFANSFDSAIVTILPETGDYYVVVRDCWSYTSERPDQDFGCYLPFAKAQRAYGVSITDIGTSTIADGEGGDDGASATALAFPRSGGNYAGVIARGTFRDVADVDVFRFTVPADLSITGDANRTYRAQVRIRGFAGGVTGPYGSGSTTALGELRLARVDDPTTIIARLVPEDADQVMRIPVDRGVDYLLSVVPAADSAPSGDRDFYFLAVIPDRSLPLEAAKANDDIVDAEVPKEIFTDDTEIAFQFDGDLTPASDVDYYTFPIANPKREIDLVCWGVSLGSGLQGLTATLLEANGTAIPNGVATDSQERPAIISKLFPSANATSIVLKVSAASASPSVTATHYACQIILSTPDPNP